MNTWYKSIIAILLACTVQAGMAHAAEKPAMTAAEILAAIEELDGTQLEASERAQRIAFLVSRTAGLTQSDSLLGELSRLIPTADLSIVSASAIVSSGTQSPAVFRAMTDAQGSDTTRIQAIRQGATHPTTYLGTDTITLIQSAQFQAVRAPAGPVAPILVASSEAQPPPVAPPPQPVRPPAQPYRGQ